MSKIDDKILGMFYGLAIGDILGIPYEMKSFQPKLAYTGLVHQVDGVVHLKFTQNKVPMNTPSDDTRMSLALFKGLVKGDLKYTDQVLLEYLKWAQVEKSMGKNTRMLMKGVTTIKGYTNRFAKLSDNDKNSMQSNGSLMRISPMALMSNDGECMDAVKKDTYLTNPNVVNATVNFLYVQMLRSILYINATKEELQDVLTEWVKTDGESCPLVASAITDVFNKTKRDISVNKGWVINAFYIALYGFFWTHTYQEAVDLIIGCNPGSDTDTNAAIGGALCGAYYGFTEMEACSPKTALNIERVGGCSEIAEIKELLSQI